MDKSKVLEPYINDIHFFKIIPGIHQQENRYFSQSNLVLADDPKKIFESIEEFTTKNVELNFVEQNHKQQVFATYPGGQLPRERKYVSIYFRIDNKFKRYKREVETLLDYFGDIGGLLEIVLGVGFLLTGPFVRRSMNSEIINEVYQVQKYVKDTTFFHPQSNEDENNDSMSLDSHKQNQRKESKLKLSVGDLSARSKQNSHRA